MYPEEIEVNGRRYKINTDYRIALACFKAINDSEISDKERFYAVLCLLLGTDVKREDEELAFKKCEIFLRCGKETNQNHEEIDIDYWQDAGYINASFRSTYHINILKEDMHWWEYNDMITGFDEKSIMNRIREIRNLDLKDIKDPKERSKLEKAKQELSLKKENVKILNDEEKRNIDNFYEKMGIKRKE